MESYSIYLFVTLYVSVNIMSPGSSILYRMCQKNYYIWLLLLLLGCFSHVRLCVTPQTAAHQAPLSPGFSRQEHWSEVLGYFSLMERMCFSTPMFINVPPIIYLLLLIFLPLFPLIFQEYSAMSKTEGIFYLAYHFTR